MREYKGNSLKSLKLQKGKQLLALLLCACMAGTSLPVTVYAKEETTKEESAAKEETEEKAVKEESAAKEETEEKAVKEESATKEETEEKAVKEESAAKEETEEKAVKEESTAKEETTEEATTEEATIKEVASEEETTEEETTEEETVADSAKKPKKKVTKKQKAETGRHIITDWEWIDEDENLNPEDGALVLSAEKENPCLFEDVTALLPTRIRAEVLTEAEEESDTEKAAEADEESDSKEETESDNGNDRVTTYETLTLGEWKCTGYPKEGAYSGSYSFQATLPEDYELGKAAASLEITVQFDTPQLLDETQGYDEEGFCTGFQFDADGNWVKNTNATAENQCTHDNCNGYQPAVQITADNAATYGFTSDADKTKYKDYYAITNAGQLYWFSKLVNGATASNDTRASNAVLINDITVNSDLMSKVNEDGTLKEGEQVRSWIEIGDCEKSLSGLTDSTCCFKGTFTGQGHSISGLYCYQQDAYYVGLIYILKDGTVSGITLKDSCFLGKDYVGGICGKMKGNSTISECISQATVITKVDDAGGICGVAEGSACQITSCTNTGSVTGIKYVGGICGYCEEGTIDACENSGSISNTGSHAGGICGYCKAGTIDACENSGSISSTSSYVGGICGTNTGSITGCHNLASGKVSAVSYTGGICGENQKELKSCTNTAVVTGSSTVGGICGMNADSSDSVTVQIISCTNEGAVEGRTSQTGGASIGGVCGSNGTGSTVTGSCNKGVVSAAGDSYVGGVCGWNRCKVSNCQNTGSTVTGKTYVGGICGYNANETSRIEQCTNSAAVTGTDKRVGGICGYSKGEITYSCNTGAVSGGGDNVGGIAGYLTASSTITSAYNTGAVTGNAAASAGVIYGAGGKANNMLLCYYLDTCKTDSVHTNGAAGAVTGEQLSNGAAAYRLNGSSTDSPAWYQNLDNAEPADAFPLPDSTHGTVYPCTPCTEVYSNTPGKTAEHSEPRQCDSGDGEAAAKHICGICGTKLAHSAIIYKESETKPATIEAFCDCGYCYGSVVLTAPLADSLTYDGNPKQAVTADSVTVPSGITHTASEITYYKLENGAGTALTAGQRPTDAGDYEAAITCGSGTAAVTVSVTYTIDRAEPAIRWADSEKKAAYTGNAILPGKLPSLNITGVESTSIAGDYTDSITYSYRSYREAGSAIGGSFISGLPTERGCYEIKAAIPEKGNYKAAETETALTLTINWLETDKTAVLTDQNNSPLTGDNWWAQSVTLSAPEGFSISSRLQGDYDTSFAYGTQTGQSGAAVTYYLKNAESEIAEKTATVYIDRTAPDFPKEDGYGIQIQERWYKSLLNEILFGCTYQSMTDVQIQGRDELSGIAGYEYYIDDSGSTTALTEAGLAGKIFTYKAADSEGTVNITQLTSTNEIKKYVVYARAVDKAGNKGAYICSGGVVVDDVKPEITGVTVPQKADGTLRDSGADFTFTATEAGTYYYMLQEQTEPAPTDINAFASGVRVNGKTAWTAGSGVFTAELAEGNGNFVTVSGLEPETAYTLYIAAVDEVGNATAAVTQQSFTTLKRMPVITVQPELTGIYGQSVGAMHLTDGKAVYGGQAVTGAWSLTDTNTADVPAVGAGTEYEVTFTPAETQYETLTVKAVPSVAKKPVTVTAEDKSRKYGEVNPPFTFTVPADALVGGDTADDLAVTLSCKADAASPVKTGGYGITGTSASANYAVTVTSGVLTVDKAEAVITTTASSFTKTFGEEAFLLGVTSNNREKAMTYTVSDSKTLAGETAEDDAVITVNAAGTVTIKGTGEATVTVASAESANYTEAQEKTITVHIDKKSGYSVGEITRNYVYSKAAKDTVSLKPYLPKDCGAVSYAEPTVTGCVYDTAEAENAPAVTAGVLAYTVKSASAGDTGSVSVTVTTANYEDFTITVNAILTDYTPITITGIGFSGVTDTTAGVTLTAQAGDSGIAKYYLYYTTAASESVRAENIKTGAEDSTAGYLVSTGNGFSLTGLTKTTTYYVYAVAEDADGHLGTMQLSAFTTRAPEPPRTSGDEGSSSGASDSGSTSGSSAAATGKGTTGSTGALTGNITDGIGTAEGSTDSGAVQPQPQPQPEQRKPYTGGKPAAAAKQKAEEQPHDRTPFIKGDNGKEGWTVIRSEVENASEGSTVTVDMNGASVVPGEVISDIRGRDVTLVFDMGNGITWSVNGRSITADRLGDIDFGVTLGAGAGRSIPVDVLNNVTGERYSMNLTLAYEGELGFTAVLTLNVKPENAGLFANLFYYNQDSGELEFICYDEIAADGTAELTFTHASDYTIVIDTEPMDGRGNVTEDTAIESESDDTAGNASAAATDGQTVISSEAAWSPWWIIVTGAVILIIGLGIFLATGKKRKTEN